MRRQLSLFTVGPRGGFYATQAATGRRNASSRRIASMSGS